MDSILEELAYAVKLVSMKSPCLVSSLWVSTVHIYNIDIFSRYTYSFSLLSINLCRLLQFDIIIDIYFSFQLFEKHHLSSITVARLVAS